jgi:hypothetical protein
MARGITRSSSHASNFLIPCLILHSIFSFHFLRFDFSLLFFFSCFYCARDPLKTKFSHLDIVGRPVTVLEKNNVVPEHNQHFQVLLAPFLSNMMPNMLAFFFFFFFIYNNMLAFETEPLCHIIVCARF